MRRKRIAWLLMALGLTMILAAWYEGTRLKCSCALGERTIFGVQRGSDDPADCDVHGPIFEN